MLIFIFSFYLIFSLYKLIFFAYLYSQLSVDSVLKLARVFYALCNYSKSSKPRKVYLHPKKKRQRGTVGSQHINKAHNFTHLIEANGRRIMKAAANAAPLRRQPPLPVPQSIALEAAYQNRLPRWTRTSDFFLGLGLGANHNFSI